MRSQTVRGTEWLSLFTRLILYFLYQQFSYPQKKIFCQILSLVLIYLFSRLLVKKLKRILKNQGHCWAISGLFTIVCIVVVIKYGASDGKESACDERLGFNSWVRKILWRREWLPNSSILAWSILWTEEPSGLQSIGVAKSWTWLSDWYTLYCKNHWKHPVIFMWLIQILVFLKNCK